MTPDFSDSQPRATESAAVVSPPLLTIRNLAVSFDAAGGTRTPAVSGLGLTIHPQQTVALVGESGCGKSVTSLSILRLISCPPGRIDRGSIEFDGRDLLTLPCAELRRVRGGEIAMIFQEPRASLNPVFTIGDQIIEAVRLERSISRRDAQEFAIAALQDVGIRDPASRLRAYPHEFSGGMCQRVMTAIALARSPKLLLADEPTTALDVTIQAQILDLMSALRKSRKMSILLITHDLGVVARVADVVCMMYAGRCVEYASVADLFAKPMHPYTRGLFSSIPRLTERRRRLRTVSELMEDPEEFRRLDRAALGLVPWWPAHQPPPEVDPRADDDSALIEIEPEHWVRCWRTRYVAEHPITPPDIASAKLLSRTV